MKNIIIPTDFSENSKHALSYAYNLYKEEGCNFYLVNAYDTPHAGVGVLVSIIDVLKKESEKDMEDFYATLEKDGLTEGVKFHKICDHGSLVDVVMRIYKRYDADLIVMGTKGAGGIRELLIGSNTSDIINNSSCPIIVVPEKADLNKPKSILLSSDNKVFADSNSFTSIRDIAVNNNSKILVLNVKNSPISTDVTTEIKENYADLLNGASHSFESIEDEDVTEAICSYVSSNDIDLLAMTSRKIGFLESLFHKSMTEEMAMHTKIGRAHV